MQLSLAIADHILNIVETGYHENHDGTSHGVSHLVNIVDTFPDENGNTKTQTCSVDSEEEALEVARGFVSEEPTGKFVELFPDYAP